MKVFRSMLFLCVPLIAIRVSSAEDNLQPPDKSQWIDPTDMIYDVEQQKKDRELKLKQNKNSKPEVGEKQPDGEHFAEPHISRNLQLCKAKLNQYEKQMQKLAAPETPYFRQYVSNLAGHFSDITPQVETEEELTVCVEMLLTPHALEELDKFKNGGPVQDAHSVLVNSVKSVRLAEIRPSWFTIGMEWGQQNVAVVCQIIGTISLVSLAISMQIRHRVRLVPLFYKLLILLFLLSIPWNWWHLYKLEAARRYADMLQEVPPDCKPKHKQSLWEAFTNAMSLDVDACTKYHQRMMTDPFWEIPPTKALAVTVTKFMVEPLEHIGAALNGFIQATLSGLPLYLWPVAIFFAILVLMLAMVMTFGYRLNLFYMFGIEPGQHRGGLKEHQLQLENRGLQDNILGLTDENNRLKRELEQSQRALEESNLALDAAQSMPAIEPPPYPRETPVHIAPVPYPKEAPIHMPLPAENLGPRYRRSRPQYDERDGSNSRGQNGDVKDTSTQVMTPLPVHKGSGDNNMVDVKCTETIDGFPQTTVLQEQSGFRNRSPAEAQHFHEIASSTQKINSKSYSPPSDKNAAKAKSHDKQISGHTQKVTQDGSSQVKQMIEASRNTPLDLTCWSVKPGLAGESTGRISVDPETLQASEHPNLSSGSFDDSDSRAASRASSVPDTVPVLPKVSKAIRGSAEHSLDSQSNASITQGDSAQSSFVSQSNESQGLQTFSPDLYSADDENAPSSGKFPVQEQTDVNHPDSIAVSDCPSTIAPVPCSSFERAGVSEEKRCDSAQNIQSKESDAQHVHAFSPVLSTESAHFTPPSSSFGAVCGFAQQSSNLSPRSSKIPVQEKRSPNQSDSIALSERLSTIAPVLCSSLTAHESLESNPQNGSEMLERASEH